MTQEEKAKRYDEALERAKDFFKANQKIGESEENDTLSDIFPELKESEDERIRKSLIEHLQCDIDDMSKSDCPFDFEAEIEELSKYIAWLEKQGEQKTKWSDDDEELSVLRDVQKEYTGRTIDNIIDNLQARLDYYERAKDN